MATPTTNTKGKQRASPEEEAAMLRQRDPLAGQIFSRLGLPDRPFKWFRETLRDLAAGLSANESLEEKGFFPSGRLQTYRMLLPESDEGIASTRYVATNSLVNNTR
jgi:hypothetical protein